jgi:hypothetical protein
VGVDVGGLDGGDVSGLVGGLVGPLVGGDVGGLVGPLVGGDVGGLVGGLVGPLVDGDVGGLVGGDAGGLNRKRPSNGSSRRYTHIPVMDRAGSIIESDIRSSVNSEVLT